MIEAARPKSSPLHRQVFDKGVKDAAEEYYKDNARRMIRSLEVQYEDIEMPEPTRAFVVVKERRQKNHRSKRFYTTIEEALEDPTGREKVLSQALRDAATWRKKYAALSELAQVFRAIDKVSEAIL